MICPSSSLYFSEVESLMEAEGIKISVAPSREWTGFEGRENMITAAGILSAYSPREKDYEPCAIYPLSAQLTDIQPAQSIGVTFGFNEEMIKNISNYEKCIVYFTLVIGKDTGMTKRWFNQYSEEYLLSNDADGRFEGGEQIG